MSVELDGNALKDILSTFAGRMGAKWDFIGIQLRQGELVQDLRSSPHLGRHKVQQIIDEWLGSEDEEVPRCAATVSRVLRSPAVRLGAVAKDFEEEVQRRASSQRAAPQHPVSQPPHSLASTGAYTSTGASTSHFEGTLSFQDRPFPSNPHSVPQESPSSNPSSFSQRQPSNPSSLALPQQAQEGGLRPHLPSGGGGRADSGPVQGVESLVQQPVQEQGGPAEGDVLRGPEQGDAVHDESTPVMEDVLEAITKHIKGVLRDQYSRPPGNEAAMAKSFGQRCLPFHEQARIASAVCRTVWDLQIEGKKIYGSGSIVSCWGKFFLLTSCHNFLKKADGDQVQDLEDDYVEVKMKKKCKVAKYLFSTRDFKSTVSLPARVVLKNCEDPVLIFDQVHDLLAVEVNNPADFPAHLEADAAAALIPVQPIPLQPGLRREKLLESALLLTIAHFPREDGHRAECLELAVGLRVIQEETQESTVLYTFDTYHGSSGAPVLFAKEDEVVLLAVHRKSTATRMLDAAGQRTSIGYNVGSVLSEGFLRRLCPNDQSQDLLKFQQQYSEVVRNQASITVRITKCTTIGPPRMGKTCFKHLLTGQEWDVKAGTASTDIMETPEWVECYSLEEGGAEKPWKLLSTEQQQGELIRAVNTLIITGTHLTTTPSDAPTTSLPSEVQHPALPNDTPTTTSPGDAQHISTTSDAQHPTTRDDAPTTTSPSDAQQSTTPDDAQTTVSSSDAQHSTTPDDAPTAASPSDAQHSFTPSDVQLRTVPSSTHPPTKPDSAQKPATIRQALEALAGAVKPKAVQDFLKDRAGKVLGETRLIHFVDTGGQSVYHDVHPVLITSPSVYVVVFNLHDLHQKSNEEQLDYFRSDLIQRPLRSIYTFGKKNPQEKHLRVSPENPTIFIVGTHLDKIPESDRKGILSTLHKMISTEIGNKPYRQFVRYDTQGQSFWAVDSTLAGREQEEEVKKSFKYITALRLMVQNRSLEMSVDIPLPWMLLKVVMEGKGVRYCKYSALLEVACERGYVREASPEADLDSMLKLFHILSLFYHKVPKGYKKEDSLVFIDPDCLYSVTSDFLMAARDEIKESCEEQCRLQTAFKEMNDSQGSSKQGQDQAVAATEEDTEDSQGDIEEKQQQSQAATKDDICHEELAEGIMVEKETIIERMRDNMNTIEQEIETVVQKAERIRARLGPESTEVVLERLQAKLMEIGWQKYKLPSMECPDASSQEAKRQLFMCRLVNSLASSVRSMLHDPERKGDVLQVRKEVAKAIESMKAQCQRRSIDSCDMDQLLAILSDLRIVAQLNDSISLVIPAALPEVPHSMDIDGTVDPLLVTVVSQTVLQVCYLPSGLFCCLISELVTGLCWTVVPMGRTHVAFTHKDITGRVHVTECKSYIKIDLESQAALEELSETCQNVREMIHESILCVYQNLLSDPTAGPTFEESLIWGFQCEEHPDDDTHIAAFYEDDDEVDCCAKCLYDLESFAVQGVKPEQLVWFSS